MQWVKASERLSLHMLKVCVRIKDHEGYGTGYYDFSRKVYMVSNIGPQGVHIKKIEWLDEDAPEKEPPYVQLPNTFTKEQVIELIATSIMESNEDAPYPLRPTLSQAKTIASEWLENKLNIKS